MYFVPEGQHDCRPARSAWESVPPYPDVWRNLYGGGIGTEDTEVRNGGHGGFGMAETMHDPESRFQRQSRQTTPMWCHFEPTLTKNLRVLPFPYVSSVRFPFFI